MRVKCIVLSMFFLLIFLGQVFATDSGSLTKANIKVYPLTYANDHNITHVALSGDGKWVGIIYHWYSSDHHSKITITDTAGNYGEITLLDLDGEAKYIALNNDASKVVVAGTFSNEKRVYVIDTATKASTYFTISDYTYPEANFDYNTFTTCGARFEYSDSISYLVSYNLNSGEKLAYIEGDKNGTSCTAPYRMSDGSFVFVNNGVKYLDSSATSLESAQLITDKYELKNFDVGNKLLVETSCDGIYYYQPLLSDKRLIFTDDSDFSPNNGCTMNWVEMGINSEYTFAGDQGGYHIVQVYGDSFPQKGRYFTGEDVTGSSSGTYFTYLYPAGWNNVNRDKHVSSDGKRIVVQAGTSYYDENYYKLYVVEVTDSNSDSNNNGNTGTTSNCSATLYESGGNYYLNIPVANYADSYYYSLTFQYYPTLDNNILFVISDYSELTSESASNCASAIISSTIDMTIPDITYTGNGTTLNFSANMSVYDWNTGLFYLYNIIMK